ncbi:MAG: 4-hydroxy-tetrahydrodipicolinate synthase [Phycisphaerales bacterium]|nr:4-hydroxy-tetrahydrodipicolinate synthase [Phycisphaerales bacterium]
MITFAGAYTALITPFCDDGTKVDLGRLGNQVAFQAQGGVRGIVPCGTTGEAPTLAEHEHAAVIECAVSTGRPLGLQIVAGAGSNSTAQAIHLHRLAASLGAHAALQVTPYYNKPSQEGLYRHFMAIAESAELPIVLYNIPGRAAVTLLPETVERLAKHPNIVAIKEATGSMDSASEIHRRCSIAILSGDDSLTASFAAVGAVGVVSVVSNLVPDRVARLCHDIASGDLHALRRSHESLFGLSRGLLALDVNPVPLKCAMAILERDTGAVRLPLVRASEQVRAAIESLLREAKVSGNTDSLERSKLRETSATS